MINLDHVKCGKSGIWAVTEFTVSEDDAKLNNARAAFGSARMIRPGTYKSLSRGNQVIMSNTPEEIRDHMYFIRQATGSVLINGLGLGMCLTEILNRSNAIEDVTVIEKSSDVISLVSPSFNDPRVSIIQADAFDYKPEKGKRFNAVWHDIWDNLCTDNLTEMEKLHRKYGRRCDWQGSWGKEILLHQRNRERKESRRWRAYA